jgi:molecular chaperone GrpE
MRDQKAAGNGQEYAPGQAALPEEEAEVESRVEALAEALAEAEQAQQEAEQKVDLAARYLDALQRERASFINYRRRIEQERAEERQYAASELVKKLLPVVDDFDRALASIPEEVRRNNPWVEGMELIARKLHKILEQEGVQPIEALGQPFDPNLHEAVAFEDHTIEGEARERTDTVSEVFRKGYKMHNRVLRPAMVKVTRK